MQIRRFRIKNNNGNKNGIPRNDLRGIATKFCKSTSFKTKLFIKIDSPYATPKEISREIKPLTIDSFK